MTEPGKPLTPELRTEAQAHIEAHARGESARIEKLSRVREFVLGAQDGLLVPLGVVTGMAAAQPARATILVAGLAEAVAGAIAMGGGSYLASEAEEALYAAEIRDERQESIDQPEREIAELAIVLEDEGLAADAALRVARGLSEHPEVFLRTKVQKELGLSPDAGGDARGDALVVGLTYLAAAFIPIWPYMVLPLFAPALFASLACTFVALFALGVTKGTIARQARARAGLQVSWSSAAPAPASALRSATSSRPPSADAINGTRSIWTLSAPPRERLYARVARRIEELADEFDAERPPGPGSSRDGKRTGGRGDLPDRGGRPSIQAELR